MPLLLSVATIYYPDLAPHLYVWISGLLRIRIAYSVSIYPAPTANGLPHVTHSSHYSRAEIIGKDERRIFSVNKATRLGYNSTIPQILQLRPEGESALTMVLTRPIDFNGSKDTAILTTNPFPSQLLRSSCASTKRRPIVRIP